jgi:long-subunit fatty acid transport protein
VPVFPDVYAVYKKGSWAFHFGFGPNAGGGSAEFNDGLPSFEQEIAKLPIGITTQIGMPTSKYSSEIAFKGSSAFYGYQVGASYAVTKKLGVSLGVRYLQAVNTYEGSITNIMVNPTHPVFNPTGAMISASAFFNQLYQATVAMGTPNPVLLGYAKNTADKQVDAKQTGSGVTPIIGVNYQFSDKVSAGIKYELQTALELTNETKVDGSGLFPDGAKSNSDVPAILAGGVAYKPIPKLLLAVSGNYYFDTAVSWESRKVKPDGNTWEAQLGAQYCLTPKWAVSVGYNLAKVSLPDEFQSDLNHNLSSNSFGFGFRWQALKALAVDLGALITLYDEFTESQTSPFGAYDLTYSRDNWDVAIGLCYSLK